MATSTNEPKKELSIVFTKVNEPPAFLSNLVRINDDEFMGVTNMQYSLMPGLYKYNVIYDKWILLISNPSGCRTIDNGICYDEQNQLIYSLGREPQMIIYNLATSKVEVIETNESVGSEPELLMIGGECHIILGRDSVHHYKWNATTQKLEAIFTFTHLGYGLFQHGISHIKSQHRLLLLGGYDDVTDYSDEIWEYHVDHNDEDRKWEKLKDVKLPTAMCNFGCILSKNEDYLITFGGEDDNPFELKNIFILDLYEMKFYSSKIKMREQGRVYPISMNNENSIIFLSGFIRNISKEYDINIPTELIQLFHAYLESDTIYLCIGRSLYKAELNDILANKVSDLSIDYYTDDESCEEDSSQAFQ